MSIESPDDYSDDAEALPGKVTNVTPCDDNYTDGCNKMGQNENNDPSVPAASHLMMDFATRTTGFVADVFAVAGDLLEETYWILPQLERSLDQHVVFVCKPPMAHKAPEAYRRIMAIDCSAFIHFHLYCQAENKEHLIPAFQRYEHQALSDRLGSSSSYLSRSIMATNQSTEAANLRKWTGMSNYLRSPKALRYWEYILNDRPLVASAYIYSADDRNQVLSVGAKRTFSQLNRKVESGAPAILNQTASDFDEQIRPYRTQAIAEVKQHGQTDVPHTFTRDYYDGALGMDFAFIEEVYLLGTGEVLNICSYQTEDLDRYWVNRAAAEQRQR